MPNSPERIAALAQERFELLAHATSDVVWDWNLMTNNIWWNDNMFKAFGYALDDIEPDASSWTSRIHPDDLERVVHGIHAVIDGGGKNWSDEYRFRRADGSYAHIYDRGYTQHVNGTAVRMVGCMMDVTERVALEASAREAKESMNLALDAAKLGTWDLDLINNRLQYDSRIALYFGFAPNGEVTYENVLENIHPDDVEQVKQKVDQAMHPASGGIYAATYRTVSAFDQKVRWIKAQGRMYFDNNGQAYRFRGICADVSDEFEREQQRAEAEERLNFALNAARLGTWDLLLDEQRVRFDRLGAQLFGFDPSQHIEYTQVLQHMHPDDRPKVDAAVKEALTESSGGNYFITYRVVLPDTGEERWVRARGQAYFRDGQAYRFSGIVADISNEVLLQNARRETEERMNFALESARLGTWEMNLLSGETNMDARARYYFGYSDTDVVDVNEAQKLVHPDDWPRVEEAVGRAMAPGSDGRYLATYRLMQPNGQLLRWIKAQGQVAKDADEKPLRFSGVVSDVTDEVHMEQARREAEERMNLALAAANLGTWSADYAGGNLTLDDLAACFFGFDHGGTFNDQVISARIFPEDFPAIIKETERALDPSSSGSYNVLYRIWRLNDGEVRWLRGTGQAYFNSHGQLLSFSGVIADVTEEHLAQQAREEAEERMNIALNAAELGTWDLDLARNKVRFDNRVKLYFGFGAHDNVTYEQVLEHVHPDDVAKVDEAVQQALNPESGGVYSITYRTLSPADNKVRWVRAQGKAYFTEDGRPYRFSGIASDITDEVRRENALRNIERRFQVAFDNASMGISINDTEGNFVLINKAYQDLTGYTVEELYGGDFFRLTHPDDLEANHRLIKELGEGLRNAFEIEKRYIRKDGSIIWVLANVSATRNENNEIESFVGIVRDITLEKQASLALQHANRELAEAKRQFQFVTDFMPQLVWATRPDGYHEFYNQRWYEYTGLSHEESENTGWSTVLHPEDYDRAILVWQHSLETGDPYQIEYRFKRYDGEYRWFLGRALPLRDENGEISKWFGTCTDIHDQKMQNEELEQRVAERTAQLQDANAVLQHTNRNLEQFAYVASHDLQEPLRKIRMFSNLLLERNRERLEANGVSYLERMIEASQRMAGLIKDLLDFSRATSQADLITKVNLATVLSQVTQDFDLLISQRNAVVTMDELPTVEAIPLQMNQLFYNLVSNGLKFTRPDQPPVLHIGSQPASPALVRRFPNLRTDLDYVHIIVRDNGIGFDPAFAEKIFVIFQRLHTRQQFEGTGIGLALCQKIVANHRGEIWAESTEGQGATFHILLPLTQPRIGIGSLN